MNFQEKLLNSLRLHSDRIAIESGIQSITYAELLEKSVKVTSFLLSQNLAPETLVGINLDEKAEMITTMIGVINARCSFVLLDHTLPEDRLSGMISDMQLLHVITRGDRWIDFRSPKYAVLQHHDLDDIMSSVAAEHTLPEYNQEDSLYVYFTSGSTGKPKGIVGRNGSLLQFVEWEREAFDVDTTSRFSQFISPFFDAFLRDVFVPLFSGGTLCIPPKEEDFFTAEKLTNWIEDKRISMIHCVPSLFRIFNTESIKTDQLGHLKYILMSGEKINPSELTGWFSIFNERIQLVNLYGTTETTMIRSCYKIRPKDTGRTRIPIGNPISGTELLIANKEMRPCNPLIPGDLYIVSNYVTKGYLNDEALTNEKFIRIRKGTPEETIAFKTGDKARKLPGGLIELLGREDRQIKLRGIRIELDEIESVMIQSGLLTNALILIDTNDNKEASLVAFVINKESGEHAECNELTLRQYCASQLPTYMVPANIQAVGEFPLLSNGKVDAKKLMALLTPERELIAPASGTEEKLLGIWKQVLGDKDISVEDSFHHIGGNSLTIMNLISHINKVFGVRISLGELFKNTTIRMQGEFIDKAKGQGATVIPKAAEADAYPLTSAQKRLYFLYQFDKDSLAYNMPQVVRLKGNLEIPRLTEALNTLVQRHQSLQTVIEMEGERPVQRIHSNTSVSLESYESDEEGAAEVIRRFVRPFDMEKAPLFRVGLVSLAKKEYLLMVDIHHIVTDGISQSILVRDFMALYNQTSLPVLQLSYHDYAVWRHTDEEQKAIGQQRDFWKHQFVESVPPLQLPTDFQRPQIRSNEGATLGFRFDEETTDKLKSIATDQGATMYMVLLSVYNLFLARLSGSTDICIGTPVTDRPHADLAGVLGVFVNTLVLRNRIDKDLIFSDFLEKIKSSTLSFFDHKEYPYEELIDELDLERNTSYNPLFDVVFDYQNFEHTSLSISDLELTPYHHERTESKFDLTLRVREENNSLFCDFEYATQLFKPETINRFIAYFGHLVDQVIENPKRPVAELSLIVEEEKEKLIMALDFSDVFYPKDLTLVDLFETQVLQNPDKIALTFEDTSISYQELDTRANQLSTLLIQKGLKGNGIVGLLIDRSIDTIVGMLAIMKAGGAYLPIDVDYPQNRIDYMIEDSKMELLVTLKEWKAQIRQPVTVVCVEESLEINTVEKPVSSSKSDDLCYIIYTSGTTGKPKGVMVEHRNVVRLLFNDEFQFSFSRQDVWSMFHSHCFDFSVWEMYGALLFGARLVIVPKVVAKDTEAFLRLLDREKVTVLSQTPSAFYSLVEQEELSHTALNLRYIVFGGEALSPVRLKGWYERHPEVKLVNMYGITETTVHVTYKEIGATEISSERSNIGKPIPTLSAYILDAALQPVPHGVAGEVYIGGAGVTRGYLNKETLTKERFFQNPYNSTQRLYKSGDLAKLLPSGDMEHLGRIDDQVQLRGFRIELEEIEQQLTSFEQIEETVVVMRENAEDKYLIAYYRSVDELEEGAIKKHLALKLPDYMIPAFYIQVDRFPLTSNGKLDKKRLPDPEIRKTANYIAPGNEIEEKLVELWSEVLHINKDLISLNTSFFDLGGNSLKLVRLKQLINQSMGWDLSIADLFRFTTIATLVSSREQPKNEASYRSEAEDEVIGMQDVLDSF